MSGEGVLAGSPWEVYPRWPQTCRAARDAAALRSLCHAGIPLTPQTPNPTALLFSCCNAIFARSPIGGNCKDNKLQMLVKLSPGEQAEKKPKQKNPQAFCCLLVRALKEKGSRR